MGSTDGTGSDRALRSPTQQPRSAWVRLACWTVTAAAGAVLASWWCIADLLDASFVSPINSLGPLGQFVPYNLRTALLTAPATSQRIVCLAVVGGLNCAALAAAQCMIRRRRTMLPQVLLVSLLLGHLYGAAAGTMGVSIDQLFWIFRRDLYGSAEGLRNWQMHRGIAVHSVSWMLIGVSAAVSIGFAWESTATMRRVAAGTIVGAALAAVLYPLMGAVLFPLEQTDNSIPTGAWNQFLWVALPILLMSAGITRTLARTAPILDVDDGKSDAPRNLRPVG